MFNEYASQKTISSTNISQNIYCDNHDELVKFICTDRHCTCKPLLCSQCLDDHRNHNWKTLPQFYSQVRTILDKQEPQVIKKMVEGYKGVKSCINNLKKMVQAKMNLMEQTILKKFGQDKQFYQKMNIKSKNVQNEKIEMLLKMYRRNKVEDRHQNWIQNMNFFIEKSLCQSEIKIISILNDLQISFDTNWRKKNQNQTKKALKQLKKQRQEPRQILPVLSKKQYFKFHQAFTHSSLILSDENTIVEYSKKKPKGPVAIASNSITKQMNKFAFQILTIPKIAFIFPDTTVMIGLCNTSLVKSANLQKISDQNKNAYLIGSTGWSYHHKNVDYNRKSTVGWTFSQGDIIQIQVLFQLSSKVIFKKKGIFFDSSFQLPLYLDIKEISNLSPCISFQGQIGCKVKLINLYSKED